MAGLPGAPELRCATWNIAAINNNPFEYYLTLEGEEGYSDLMQAVQALIDGPWEREPTVGEIFTADMWAQMKEEMAKLGWEGVDKVQELWAALAQRRIVTEFLKDKELGSKRLASMPDRFTNTINCADGSVVCRPTIINNYAAAIDDVPHWYGQWRAFMFETEVSVKNKKGAVESKRVCSLLQPIQRAKYPALSEEEEAVSLPLQTLCLAIFDAVLVHLVLTASNPVGGKSIDWYGIKMSICQALVVNKQTNVIRILTGQPEYAEADVIFLQEVAGAFVERLQSEMNGRFVVLVPAAADNVRDQNSVILVARRCLPDGVATTNECSLADCLVGGTPVADGDVCAFTASLTIGENVKQVLLASFHGDTAGLASTPVVNAVRKFAARANIPLVMGCDANTHRIEDPKGSTKFVGAFLDDLKTPLEEGGHPVAHTWEGEPTNWITTCNARSYLQPQLNKAVPFAERQTSRSTDRNPKDFILFSESTFDVAARARRDNTGKGAFKEGLDLPTLEFPSDHAIVWSALVLKVSPEATS